MESKSEYLLRRSSEERHAADQAVDEKVREVHSELAERYRDAAGGRALPKSPEGPEHAGLPDDLTILE